MRKIVAILLTLSALLLYTACGESAESASNSGEDTGSTEVTAATTAATSAATTGSAAAATTAAKTTAKAAVTKAVTAAATTKATKAVTTAAPAPAATTAATTAAVATAATTAVAHTVKVTVPEGYSFTQIAKLLEEKGVCTKDKLMATINSYDFSYYALIGALASDANRCFKLEGYLFPDTYEFYANDKPENVLGRFLKNAESKITDAYRTRAGELGYTMDQIVALASIIQKEAVGKSAMPTISSVFWNRIKSGMRLQSDATINYIEWYVKPYLDGDINRYNSFYNTYKCAALPSGAIGNPGKAAIEAALNPEATEYLYFVSDKAGNYYYAKTFEEHVQNCATAGVQVTEGAGQ